MGKRVVCILLPLFVMMGLASTGMAQSVLAFDPLVCGEYVYGETDLSETCVAMMITFPEPPGVVQINPDYSTLSTYDYWQVGPQAINVHESPGGAVIRQIPRGYNFINAINTSVEGWIEIEGGGWIQASEARHTQPSEFRGVMLLDGLRNPFGWLLDTTGMYTSAYPGGPQDVENGRLMFRYDMFNVYSEYEDEHGWIWYLVGPDQWIEQRFVAVALPVERPEEVEGRWVAIDLYEQTLVAYENDTPVFATLISSGVNEFPTNEGVFTIWARLDRDAMSGATGAPDAYALQSVPWTMYFDGGISLHGTYWHDLFGYRHSHGCVNLTISDARHIYRWTQDVPPNEAGEVVNYVYVYSSGEFRST